MHAVNIEPVIPSLLILICKAGLGLVEWHQRHWSPVDIRFYMERDYGVACITWSSHNRYKRPVRRFHDHCMFYDHTQLVRRNQRKVCSVSAYRLLLFYLRNELN